MVIKNQILILSNQSKNTREYFSESLDKLSIFILHHCLTEIQNQIKNSNITLTAEILNSTDYFYKGEFKFKEIREAFDLKGSYTPKMLKSVKFLKTLDIKIELVSFEKNRDVILPVFKKIDYKKGFVSFEFNKKYLDYFLFTDADENNTFFTSKELKKFKTKYTYPFILFLKKRMILDHTENIKLNTNELGNIFLGFEKYESLEEEEKTYFKHAYIHQIMKSVNADISLKDNTYLKIEIIEKKIRTSFIEYTFAVTTSSKELKEIAPEAFAEQAKWRNAISNYEEFIKLKEGSLEMLKK